MQFKNYRVDIHKDTLLNEIFFNGEIYKKDKLYGLFNLSKYSFELWDLHGNKNTLKLPLYVKRAIQRLI